MWEWPRTNSHQVQTPLSIANLYGSRRSNEVRYTASRCSKASSARAYKNWYTAVFVGTGEATSRRRYKSWRVTPCHIKPPFRSHLARGHITSSTDARTARIQAWLWQPGCLGRWILIHKLHEKFSHKCQPGNGRYQQSYGDTSGSSTTKSTNTTLSLNKGVRCSFSPHADHHATLCPTLQEAFRRNFVKNASNL